MLLSGFEKKTEDWVAPEGLDGEPLLAANELTANKLQPGSSCANQK